ncbi:GNAT family N-acetyltransferase [Rhizocola hellebori]|uniref:GNAT family N-acetyltransferase n=1 Tax=Rhizocola hellebori TaxID=1392758 RepID=UPI001943A3B3|nr:GNAT family N-acetyltransferase [Rhizocola hellebori]
MAKLTDFLIEYLGDWPGTPGLTIAGAEVRIRPGWDGQLREVVGVGSPQSAVISVPPSSATLARDRVLSWEQAQAALPEVFARPDSRVYYGTFRWTYQPTDLPDAGVWIPADDPLVPPWLHPFGGDVLMTLIDGKYAAGVGIKRHNASGLEISVGTEPEHRGKGLAAGLVAQAARWILAQDAVPIYLHDPANVASDRTANAAGFPDEGWQILGMG